MASPFADGLPSTLVLAALVGTFLSLRKHAPSARTQLWTYAWLLVLVHFSDRLISVQGTAGNVIGWLDSATLELAGIVFAVSLIPRVEDVRRRRSLLAWTLSLTALHALFWDMNWHAPRFLAVVVGLLFFGGAALAVFGVKPLTRLRLATGVVIAATGVAAVYFQLRGQPEFAVNAVLTLGYGLSSIFFWQRYPRFSAGVITTVLGFFTWGGIWPLFWAMGKGWVNFTANPELWNVPKFFVAFGMVLAMIEEKSLVIERSGQRERAANQLLLRLSHLTSQLLAGRDPAALCDDIARVIAEASAFRKAAILLVNWRGEMRLAGSSGLSGEEAGGLEERVAKWPGQESGEPWKSAARIGNHSFRLADSANAVAIRLASKRGSHVGLLWLGGAEGNAPRQNSDALMVEVLASDLAVSIENSRLHHRVMRSEKLAALGQLVAGVAHELNNPLTGILGYAEILGEEVKGEGSAKRLQKLANEARRVKRIVDGLLRFARQGNAAARATDLETALADVVHLQDYRARKRGIQISIELEAGLPRLAIGEDELKQLLLNVLDNALDAVEESAQREVRIRGRLQGNRIVVQFEDSGPGFADLNRAFDPFYTTKPLGKGTGLGLSICYGIVQECNGEISAANRQPFGGSVEIEIPVASAAVAASVSLALPA